MNLWTIKATLYKKLRNRSLFGRILKKENENLRLLLSKIPQTVLKTADLGCGDGNVLNLLRQRFPHAQFFGLDRSPAMLKKITKCRKTYLIRGDACRIPLKKNRFDLCTAVGLSEYIKDKNMFLKNLSAILKEDGYLIITFSPRNIFTYLRLLHGIRLHLIGKKAISEAFVNNNFTIIEQTNSTMQIQYLLRKK
jgi:trans-aconitate methyltransferase